MYMNVVLLFYDSSCPLLAECHMYLLYLTMFPQTDLQEFQEWEKMQTRRKICINKNRTISQIAQYAQADLKGNAKPPLSITIILIKNISCAFRFLSYVHIKNGRF